MSKLIKGIPFAALLLAFALSLMNGPAAAMGDGHDDKASTDEVYPIGD